MGSRILPQPPEVDARVVLTVVGGFLLIVAAAVVGLLVFLKADVPGALAPKRERPFPAPTLQTTPQGDLAKFEAAQHEALSDYGWIDRDRGLAHVPIDDAMRMIAARGEHAYDPLPGSSDPPADAGGGKR
ncbi:conserved hypothetical protein [Bradyrhizobium sp. STM 3809]|nr:conserved hypothetical protein [Bradyrhizobium sp. STM 3809]